MTVLRQFGKHDQLRNNKTEIVLSVPNKLTMA